MDRKQDPRLRLVLGFQYLGPEHGSVPHLDVEVVSENGTQYYCVDYAYAHLSGEVSDEEFNRVIGFSKNLERYEKGNIKVGHAETGRVEYVSRIMVESFDFEHKSYSDLIATFAKCIADIYYDYNGRTIGFVQNSETPIPVDIQIDHEILKVQNPRDSKEAREELALKVGKTMGYIVAEFNANKNLGISEHRSPRK